MAVRDPQIRDLLISEFSQRTISQLNSKSGREQIRGELLRKLNGTIGGAPLRNLFFTEYVAQ